MLAITFAWAWSTSLAPSRLRSMATYELCVNEETAGGGVIYDSLELAIVAGEAAITPVEREDIPMTVDQCVFFTVHEREGGTALKYDSRWSYSAPGHPNARTVTEKGRRSRQTGYPGRHV